LINSLKAWIGQVTTGHGVMILASTFLAALSGSVPWTIAGPMLMAGVIGVLWPENVPLREASQATAADIATMIKAFGDKPVPPLMK
jgi:hypothetical protein